MKLSVKTSRNEKFQKSSIDEGDTSSEIQEKFSPEIVLSVFLCVGFTI
ncbi:MAG: hypothetical protein RBG13Loki_2925 [Promethearchaeota archaeon CR_4]|nr:MAG: hypothetical protein RBG13Loki_2925 [Candidatus Lokiarchaeota archaeon CR_4]